MNIRIRSQAARRWLTIAGITLFFLVSANSVSAEKTVITEADQLPRIAYSFEGNVVELVRDRAALIPFLNKMRAEIERQLEEFDIRDQATVRGYVNTLRTLDYLAGDYAEALRRIERIRSLQDKPAEKLTAGLITEALIRAKQALPDDRGQNLQEAFTKRYREQVNQLPWKVVQDSIESTNGSFQYISEALYLGGLENSMQNSVDKNGELTLGDVRSLASAHYMLNHILPLRDAVVEVTGDYIAAHRVEKENIWEERSVDLTDEESLTPVIIAIHDSGIDPAVFAENGQMWVNPGEVPDDKVDNDGNGFVDDVHGIAFDKEGHRTTGDLYPLSDEQLAAYPEALDLTKGLSDLQAAVDSPEAQSTRQRMQALTREEYKPFVENLSLYGNYTHGTHVAGIAAAGNPAVRLLNVRITFGHEILPDQPTLAKSLRSVRNAADVVEYFKEAGVRVVNMSWGGSQASIEYALEANGVGDDPDHRAEIARVLFNLRYDALVEAMKSAPEILFIPAAGNSDEDVEFTRVIPSSIDLPNVLVVGAVDQAGEETGFTSYGENIRAHANGFEVESFVPGGRRLAFSGTSMSAPNVTNLAGKLLAIDPSLSPKEVIQLIEMGTETSADGRRHLIHPRKSVALLRLRNADL